MTNFNNASVYITYVRLIVFNWKCDGDAFFVLLLYNSFRIVYYDVGYYNLGVLIVISM